jgi:hypothetical protein
MDRAADFDRTFGCGYCRDDRNRRNGNVTQIARDGTSRMILLRCSQCRSLYEVDTAEDITRRLSEREARTLFDEFE